MSAELQALQKEVARRLMAAYVKVPSPKTLEKIRSALEEELSTLFKHEHKVELLSTSGELERGLFNFRVTGQVVASARMKGEPT